MLRPNPTRVGQSEWRSAVGDRVAARSAPGRLVEGLLTVVVVSSAWAQELSLLSTTIVERLVARGFLVRRLRFVVGELPETAPPERPVKIVRREIPTSLRARLAKIQDPELRRAIEEAASLSVKGT